MEVILHTDGTGKWPDIEERKLEVLGISRLPKGMQSGRSSVAIIIVGPDGKKYACEMSMRIFLMAAGAFAAAEEIDATMGQPSTFLASDPDDGEWHG